MTRSTVLLRIRPAACALLAALAAAASAAVTGLAAAAVPAALALVTAVGTTAVAAAESACPACGAALEPGAQFCSSCGRKIDAPVAAAEDKHPAHVGVVQLVAAYDSEITSTLGSLAFESNLRIDSILGSAFAIGPGEFITDSGLMAGAKEVFLKGAGGRSIPAKIVGIDPMIGVALLSADVPGVAAPPLRSEEAVRPGETLTALGYPAVGQAGGDAIRSTGVVSGLHRGNMGIHPIEDYFQTDASLPRGLAGGPMVDARGRVVGMSTAWVWGSWVSLGQSGIGYAVPAEWIARSLAWIRAGSAQRAWMGAWVVPADAESRARYSLPPTVRLVIEQVFPSSPAAAAGLRRGDGLLKVRDQEATALPRLHEHLLGTRPGEALTVTVARGAETLSREVTLVPRPGKPRLSGVDALRYFAGVGVETRDGDTLVVGEVIPGSMAAAYKIKKGDELLAIHSKKDWEHGARDNARWRSVRTAAEIEERVATAYSDFDFYIGLRFRSRDGSKRDIDTWSVLTPTGAL
jgi:serine protease DegQ